MTIPKEYALVRTARSALPAAALRVIAVVFRRLSQLGLVIGELRSRRSAVHLSAVVVACGFESFGGGEVGMGSTPVCCCRPLVRFLVAVVFGQCRALRCLDVVVSNGLAVVETLPPILQLRGALRRQLGTPPGSSASLGVVAGRSR